MTTSDLVAIVLLVMAIGDTVLAKYFLPRWLNKNAQLSEEDQRKLMSIVNIGTLVFAGIAIVVYLTQPLG